MPVASSSLQLLRAKTCAPLRSSELIDRVQLLGRLVDVRRARLTLIHAPAGYGKSTTLLQWFYALQDTSVQCAWLSADALDRDPFVFLSYLVDAVEQTGYGIDSTVRQQLNQQPHAPINAITTSISNDFSNTSEPLFLFIDDAQHLIASKAGQCLRTLIEHAPPQIHFVLASRERVDFPLARWRGLGELFEVGVLELKFDSDEIAALLIKEECSPLDNDSLALLDARTEGWIWGLRLACRLVKQEGGVHALDHFSGERYQVADFFAEDVFARQSADLQQFLLKTSVLGRLCSQLCDAVTGLGHGRQFIDQCERGGLFLVPLDSQRSWYRYHPLFAEFLRRRLSDESPQECARLYCIASDWLYEQCHYDEAIAHALLGSDPSRAAKILDARCEEMTSLVQDSLIKDSLIKGWVAQIPLPIQSLYPRLMLTAAWRCAFEWRFDDALTMIARSQSRLHEMQVAHVITATEAREFQYLVLHRQMMLAQFQDDMPTVQLLCETLIKELTTTHPYLEASLHSALLNASREQYKLANIERLDALSRAHLRQSNNLHAYLHEAIAGPAWYLAGNTAAAMASLEAGLASVVRVHGHGNALGAMSALPLAEIYYERNELGRARQLIDVYLPVADELGHVEQLVAGWLTHARLTRLSEGVGAALRVLDKAGTVAAQHGFERLRLWVGAERVKFLLRDAQLDEATRVVHDMGIPRDAVELMPGPQATTRDEARALAWFRLAQAKHRTSEAAKVAKSWRSFCVKARAVRSAIRWEILLSGLLLRDGELRPAQRMLREAILSSSRGRLMRSFLDEGALIGTLLSERSALTAQIGDGAEAFVTELVEAFGRESGRSVALSGDSDNMARLNGAINPKEMEILVMIGSGMLNREIGKRLGMTEGSVKWYLQQIFNKIGVRRRSQAVDRARQIGLIV